MKLTTRNEKEIDWSNLENLLTNEGTSPREVRPQN